jgi:hypothetical protein
MTQPRNCKACLAQHDEEIHAATDRVREWFRAQVTKHLHDAGDVPKPHAGEQLGPAHLDAPHLAASQLAAPQLDAA